MLKNWAAALFLFAGAVAAPAPERVDESRAVFREIDRVLEKLTEISGFELKHKVPHDLISRDRVRQFLEQRVHDVVRPEDIRAEEITLKLFGLVPQDFDLRSTTVDLLTEQAAAFYDFHKKRLYITDWTPSATREAALVHELAHALADQNFNLSKFIRQGQENDDGAMARMAVMEGQASWLMAEYMARQMGQSLVSSPSLLTMMSRSMEPGTSDFPVFEKAPLYLRETLLFPYTKGMLFQNAVVARLGKQGLAEVFRRPPVSTQQVLHADRYFARDVPSEPEPPATKKMLKGYKDLAEGSIGELDHAILIEQYAGKKEADAVAPHWKGGQYAVFENRSAKRYVLAYAVDWDQPAFASRYFTFYRQALRKKWKKMEIRSESAGSMDGLGDTGYFMLRCEGVRVTSLEGLESPLPALR